MALFKFTTWKGKLIIKNQRKFLTTFLSHLYFNLFYLGNKMGKTGTKINPVGEKGRLYRETLFVKGWQEQKVGIRLPEISLCNHEAVPPKHLDPLSAGNQVKIRSPQYRLKDSSFGEINNWKQYQRPLVRLWWKLHTRSHRKIYQVPQTTLNIPLKKPDTKQSKENPQE